MKEGDIAYTKPIKKGPYKVRVEKIKYDFPIYLQEICEKCRSRMPIGTLYGRASDGQKYCGKCLTEEPQ